MFKCSLCLDHAEEFAALPCGHVYCYPCLVIQIGRHKQCPQCRHAYDTQHILKLYVDKQDLPLKSFFPPTSSVESIFPRLMELVEKANKIDVDSSTNDIEALTIGCERLMMQFQMEGGSAAEEFMKELERCLASLRGRLKYAARLDSAKEQNMRGATAIRVQEDRIRRLMGERNAAFSGRDEALRSIKMLEERERLWREKYDRLKARYTKHQTWDGTNQNVQFERVQELQEELKKHKAETAKYKKKYIAAKRKILQTGEEPSHDARPDDASSDDELDILPPDDPTGPSRLAHVTIRRKDKATSRFGSGDVVMDSDDSSRHDPCEVEESL
ncbi:uncharacterized protein EI90DRAFT_3084907 [Cantharellus anzutake]|uniref:uncharacterized protein n=1 Tax=Cantharellus anzutake TaxID=1750568 RepID=UPI001906666F|nr:uncharacterized protein EI90DRAFT_3084907 [Cantharellus anzutake]KAF8317763.1 hypothetical protein EI90DRAFT_3084907 [Cantharellus anzutake]